MGPSGNGWERFLVEDHLEDAGFPQAEALARKRVLITGAGGFIGSSLALALARSGARSLTLLDSSEQNLFEIERRVAPAAAVLGSVTRAAVLRDVFRSPADVVFHAAAFKHVALLERNALAALENNALGTYKVARAAMLAGVSSFVLISTDKAVEPRSVMGASKALAERLTLALIRTARVVRLCNVIGSTGSVVPLFRRQIAEGCPVTVTDREARRYFISKRETVECLLGAPASCERVAIPPYGEPVPILDLARGMIAASGKRLPIVFTGLKAGEKLCEKLDSQEPDPWTADDAHRHAARLAELVAARDVHGAMELVREAIPSYVPSGLTA